MFNKSERIIALRNLKPKKKEGFLKIISIFSFLGIMLGVAILIIVMSVMNGFRTELINKISFENNKKWVGWKGDVLFDENLDGQVKGRNFAYKPIFINEVAEIGQICTVKVVDATTHSLIGEIAS